LKRYKEEQHYEYFVEVVFVLEVVWQGLVGVVGPLEQAEVAVLQVPLVVEAAGLVVLC
jgi:hypothetical protein